MSLEVLSVSESVCPCQWSVSLRVCVSLKAVSAFLEYASLEVVNSLAASFEVDSIFNYISLSNFRY